ncbi:MAG: type 1 glutamine amidotransferase [Calditrichaeota bacterium]|nr:type 1 glutamine amidotransferase [Calditrichota bacterium]
MPKNKSDLKILLMQIRKDPQILKEELESFSIYSGIPKKQFSILNVFAQPDFNTELVKGFDALFVGGASDANVLKPEKYPFVHKCQKMLLFCLSNDIPVFASCFGFQLAVLALGGEILHKEKDFEMGSLPISLTEHSKKDPLFSDTPDLFKAIAVHQQFAREVPDNCELLAYTEQCCHAFRVKNKDFWAFQFHPEVDKNRMVERLTFYKKKYTQNDEHLDEVLASAQETPESNILARKFVDRVLIKS